MIVVVAVTTVPHTHIIHHHTIMLHRITPTTFHLTAPTPATIRDLLPMKHQYPIRVQPPIMTLLTTHPATTIVVQAATIPHRTNRHHTTDTNRTLQPVTTTTSSHTITHRLHTTMPRTIRTHTTETTSRITTPAITHPNRTSTIIPTIIAHMTTPTNTPTTRPPTSIQHPITTAPK